MVALYLFNMQCMAYGMLVKDYYVHSRCFIFWNVRSIESEEVVGLNAVVNYIPYDAVFSNKGNIVRFLS